MRRPSIARALPIAAGLALVGGLVDLLAGGTHLAAALLVAGYAVLVPAALLSGRLSR
jgi:hypothetical protein